MSLKTAAVTPFMRARWYFRAFALYASLRPPTHAQSSCKVRRHSVVRNQSVGRPIQPCIRTARLSGTTRVAQSASESARESHDTRCQASKQASQRDSQPARDQQEKTGLALSQFELPAEALHDSPPHPPLPTSSLTWNWYFFASPPHRAKNIFGKMWRVVLG